MADQAGRDVPIVWAGRRATAFVPDLLADRDLTLSGETVRHTATAASDVVHAAGALGIDIEPLGRMLLRAEGVASSFIEGIRAPVIDVVLAEEDPDLEDRAAAWVAANLAAVTEVVRQGSTAPLSIDALCRWHRTLMAGSPTPERYVGVLRSEQGWIRGTDPTNAHLVTPPPEAIEALLDDLVLYANRADLDPVAQAAVVHAQFEIVHPFADGNGRLGRLLVAWTLTGRLGLVTPPPVSAAIASDVGGYIAGLVLFRLGQHEPWVRWFADVVSLGGRAQLDLLNEVADLEDQWRERLGSRPGRALRSDAAAWRVLDLVPRYLVLTTEIVGRELAFTNKGANAALAQMVAAGILLEYGTRVRGRGKPSKLYVSPELLGLVGSSPLR